jgi:hypothetical protein
VKPSWAVPGEIYDCSPKCGYRFLYLGDLRWRRLAGEHCYEWNGTWEDLKEQYGDCSATLSRRGKANRPHCNAHIEGIIPTPLACVRKRDHEGPHKTRAEFEGPTILTAEWPA